VSLPLWAAELARTFWSSAGEIEGFPRNLRRPIARALPLSIVLLPRLSVRAAIQWLQASGVICEFPGEDRPLRACLVARGGHGIALIDGSDEEREQAFSIAHELGHFLRDYWRRRQHLQNSLGMPALEVMDGLRPPTRDELLHALIRNVSLGFQVHLMERDGYGDVPAADIAYAEQDADRLAYELLAPAEHVLAGEEHGRRERLSSKLREFYGLPGVQASRYAEILLPTPRVDPLLLRLKTLTRPGLVAEGDHV
jgi:hypothetical protein